MIKKVTIALLALLPMIAAAQEIIYDRSDSIAVERILKKHTAEQYPNKGELALAIAMEFIGKSYVSGTLENGPEEPLFVSCDQLDCSTFVELVTAMTLSVSQNKSCFSDVCRNLERVRYRRGIRNGYTSRLHYTSWWIEDNISKGVIKELTGECIHKSRILDLCFMSKHPDKYPILKNNIGMLERIEEYEIPFRGVSSDYIPKENLNDKNKIGHINNGDIIALVTTVAGLDISHVGFAYWKGDNLHLLHASSTKGKVIKDTMTLFEYQKNKKSQIGIRVLRFKE